MRNYPIGGKLHVSYFKHIFELPKNYRGVERLLAVVRIHYIIYLIIYIKYFFYLVFIFNTGANESSETRRK